MKKLIEDNYNSIVARGLIKPDTRVHDFVEKLYEEIHEVNEECTDVDPQKWCDIKKDIENVDIKKLSFELADIILVCLAFSKHYDIDIEHFLNEKIKINYERANENTKKESNNLV